MKRATLFAAMLLFVTPVRCPAARAVRLSRAAELAAAAARASGDATGADSTFAGVDEKTAWLDSIRLSGTLEGHVRYVRHRDFRLKSSGAMSDLYLRILELGIETSLSGWATAIAVLNSEWVGDYVNRGDEKMTVDEMHLDVKKDGVIPYFIFGKRTQPFGFFENDLVSDPICQDAYETNKVGATIGVTGLFESDISITGYKGGEAIDHLFQSGLFDSAAIRRNPLDIENIDSYIISFSAAPFHDTLTVFGAFSSEPGTSRRNLTLDAGLSCKAPFLPNLGVDVEYMRALQRERYIGAAGEFRESVLAVSLSYSFVPRRGVVESRGLYRARRAYKRTHPFLLGLRFERFGDDSMAEWYDTWSVRDRYLAGGRYTVYQKGNVSAYFGAEYRRTGYRLPRSASSAMSPHNDEAYLDLGFDF
jgi:hypothetical protein